jgi:lipoyl(octanoyl) transferase
MSVSSGSMSEAGWRLLNDPPASGAWNMAVDEALLEGVASGRSPATLRFYSWTPACLSLGYFQPFGIVDVDGCRARGVDVVRRPTGGRAILHDRELTYSLTLPASVLGHEAGIVPSYHRLSLALQAGLRELGVPATLAPAAATPAGGDQGPVCFDRPSSHEILLGGRKLVGSAQVRRGGALLQHGSIVIQPQIDKLLACLRLEAPARGPAARDRLADAVAGLAEIGDFDPTRVAGAVAAAFGRQFGVGLSPGRLGDGELAAATDLARSKYQSSDWTERPLAETAEKTTRTR